MESTECTESLKVGSSVGGASNWKTKSVSRTKISSVEFVRVTTRRPGRPGRVVRTTLFVEIHVPGCTHRGYERIEREPVEEWPWRMGGNAEVV